MSTTVSGKNLLVKFVTGQPKGFATIGTTPTSPASGDFWIAAEDGDYTHFTTASGNLTGVVVGDVLKYDGTNWANKGATGGDVVACSTSATLNLNQDMTQVSCKSSGSWTYSVEGQKSWDISCDGLYQITDVKGAAGFVDLSQMIITGQNLTQVIFEEVNNPGATTNGNMWYGSARLTSCSLTGDDNAASTYSASFMGEGELMFKPKA